MEHKLVENNSWERDEAERGRGRIREQGDKISGKKRIEEREKLLMFLSLEALIGDYSIFLKI